MIPFSEYFQTLRDWLDLNAQLEMAHWAQYTFYASVGALIATIAAVIAAFLTFRSSHTIGKLQNQAYVYADTVNFGDYSNIIVEVHNSGLTPATHFSLNASARIVKSGNVSASINFHDDDFKTWSAIGSQKTLTVSVLDGDETVKLFKSAIQNNGEILLVCGQIVYCTIFNEDHVTQFAFFVDLKNKKRFRRPIAKIKVFHKVRKTSARERILGLFRFNKSKS